MKENFRKNIKMIIPVIDPEKETSSTMNRKLPLFVEAGIEVLLIGGSTLNLQKANSCVEHIKKRSDFTLIWLCPELAAIPKGIDAMFFGPVLNSNLTTYLIDILVASMDSIEDRGVELLPFAMLIFEPGGTAGWVTKANLLPRNKPHLAGRYARVAETLGLSYLWLESGSGAPSPIPTEITKEIRKRTTLPLFVGGGFKNEKDVSNHMEAGANAILIGTIFENLAELEMNLRKMRSAVSLGY